MKTTDEVLAEMDREHQRKREVSDATHESGKDFVRMLCDAGLVSDVTPSGPAPDLSATCLGCNELLGDTLVCPRCPEGTPWRMGYPKKNER